MILVACGLQREAAIIKRTGVIPVVGGGVADHLENQLEDTITAFASEGRRFSVVLSSGIAGALDPTLVAGDAVINCAKPLPFRGGVGGGSSPPDPTLVIGDGPHPNPSPEGEGLERLLIAALPHARRGTIIGQDHIAASVAEKAALATTGALAVDMESHIAARVAARHGLPFIAIRTISDTALETLPPAALVGMNPDGSMAMGKVLASLARNPGQLPALIRTGQSAERAFKSLARVHATLGPVWVTLLDQGSV